jgi:alpha-beta hydrolase superfamily lysophospholipase
VNEQFADLGAVTLCYETFGDPADPALLLIMGLGTQMVGWRDDFCRDLAGRGFHVIR